MARHALQQASRPSFDALRRWNSSNAFSSPHFEQRFTPQFYPLERTLMSVSVENALSVPYRIVGNKKETVTNVTCSEKYVEGGEVVTAKNLGFSQKVDPGAICTIKTLGTGQTVNLASASYNSTTEK